MTTQLTDPMLPELFEINRIRKESYDTFTVELLPANGSHGFSFAAGQFNMLYVYGVGEVPISISGDPTQSLLLEHTTRMVGTVTKAMGKLKQGAKIGVRGPFGSAWPVEATAGNDVVLVAGGIGLAPLRPVMLTILSQREKFGNVVLLYGARTPEDILFRKNVKTWRAQFDLNVHVTVDRATGDWLGKVGVVTNLIPKALFDPYNTVAMICGPEVMMRFTVMELNKRGVPDENIYVSMERNMKCGVGFCGHCQYGPEFICKDGPVFRHDRVRKLLEFREV
ncbi:MAG: FAD/NAD(P)-binding protein [bacterium]